MFNFIELAKPRTALHTIKAIFPWVLALTFLTGLWGITEALFLSPPDYQQGDLVRIMYVHVPASWMALMVYGFVAINSIIFLIWRIPLADLMAASAGPVGLCFTAVSLLTGSIWGKTTWGTWWVWDARLTSMLLLFFLYLGYLSLRDSFSHPQRGQRSSSLLAVIGLINLPIIKWSVTWWHTLHQPASIMRWGKPAIDSAMLRPLFLMALTFLGYFLIILILRLRTSLSAQKNKETSQ
jgi:heme exporter protein C